MQIDRFCEGLLSFLQASPTPFHAVQAMISALDKAGFEHLSESSKWHPLPKGNYYTTRNDSSLIAFRLDNDSTVGHSASKDRLGFNMIGAHTDSPCLKLKPQPDKQTQPYWQLSTEVYGSPLLHTWFDRDLSIAGRIHFVDQHNELHSRLIDFEKPLAYIPSLAIHLNRSVNESSSVNAQEHLLPILTTTKVNNEYSLKKTILDRLNLNAERLAKELLDFDLYLYDCQPPQFVGLNEEYIASARLDNLLSCYVGLMALINSDGDQRSLLICNDHEEIGSMSACGAQGPFLADTLKRLFNHQDAYSRCIAQSLLISADNAHAKHPNYPSKHDDNHAPIMNQGPVIKTNANQRYATTSETSAIIQYLAQVVDIPLQSFASRADMACGSTIGPLTSGEIGVRTIDMGIPQLGMHSIREVAGKQDTFSLFNLFTSFFSLPAVPDANPILPQGVNLDPSINQAASDRSRERKSRRNRSSSANGDKTYGHSKNNRNHGQTNQASAPKASEEIFIDETSTNEVNLSQEGSTKPDHEQVMQTNQDATQAAISENLNSETPFHSIEVESDPSPEIQSPALTPVQTNLSMEQTEQDKALIEDSDKTASAESEPLDQEQTIPSESGTTQDQAQPKEDMQAESTTQEKSLTSDEKDETQALENRIVQPPEDQTDETKEPKND